MNAFYGRDFDDDGNPITGSEILDDIDDFLRRFVVFPDSEYSSVAVVLFAAHTHGVESFYVTPRLILDSAEPESGKTRVLELLALLCRNPKMTFNTTVAALYRRLQDGMLTVLLDEADAIWSAKAGPQAEELRAFVNSGYKRGATVDRCVGDGAKIKVVEFPVFAPVAIAGIAGNMPATVTTRGITIHMRRRAPGEHVEPYEEQDVKPEADQLRAQLSQWIEDISAELQAARPVMPPGVADRKAEIWRALIAIADAAGGDWPKRARAACEHFALGTASNTSFGIRLLADIKTILGGNDRMPTVQLLEKLCELEEAPWGNLRGKPLDARGLASHLRKYEVTPATFDVLDGTGKTAKGYTTYPTKGNIGLADAWTRYLQQQSSGESGKDGNSGKSAGDSPDRPAALTDGSVSQDLPEGALTCGLTQVTELTDDPGTLCTACGEPLDQALIDAGYTDHGEAYQ